jgi:hypothetical protein
MWRASTHRSRELGHRDINRIGNDRLGLSTLTSGLHTSFWDDSTGYRYNVWSQSALHDLLTSRTFDIPD